MLILQMSLYATAFGLCFFIAILVYYLREKIPAKWVLGFLTIEALMFAFEWLMYHPNAPFKGLWLTLLMWLSIFVAPSLSLIADSVVKSTQPSKSVSRRKHFSFILLATLLLVPLASSVHGGREFWNYVQPASTQYSLLIHTTMLLMVAVLVLQSCFYLKLCVKLLTRRERQNRVLFTQLSDAGTNVLRILILTVIANLFIISMRVLYCMAFDDASWVNLGFATTQLVIIAVLGFSFLRQTLDYNEHQQAVREQVFSEKCDIVKDSSGKKYQRSGLYNDHRAKVLEKIRVSLDVDKIYLDSRISLSILSDRINETPHVVSQAINQSRYSNFYQMINTSRVHAAKVLLLDQPSMTVLDIAYKVGFNSKSTFNSAFKKTLGQSPSEYRRANYDVSGNKQLVL